MDQDSTYYHRHLPHYQPPHATYFVTFRLAGSLPKTVIEELQTEAGQEELRIKKIKNTVERHARLSKWRKKYFEKFDKQLNKGKTGPIWLRDPAVASVVAEAIHYRDEKEFDLICYCIMPNHVHLLFDVGRFAESFKGQLGESPYAITNILSSLKKHTALQCNRILKRTGQFW